MMRRRFSVLLLAIFPLAAAPKKNHRHRKGGDEDLILTATITSTRRRSSNWRIDLEGHSFVADVRVEPKYGKEVAGDPGRLRVAHR